MVIDTGSSWITPAAAGTCNSGKAFSSGVVIFDAESMSHTSSVVTVAPNTAILVEAYFPDEVADEGIDVYKVVTGTGQVASGDACGACRPEIANPIRGTSRILFKSKVFLGPNGPWRLTGTITRLIIPLQGSYIFELAESINVEDVYVEYTVLENPNIVLPDGYMAGYV